MNNNEQEYSRFIEFLGLTHGTNVTFPHGFHEFEQLLHMLRANFINILRQEPEAEWVQQRVTIHVLEKALMRHLEHGHPFNPVETREIAKTQLVRWLKMSWKNYPFRFDPPASTEPWVTVLASRKDLIPGAGRDVSQRLPHLNDMLSLPDSYR